MKLILTLIPFLLPFWGSAQVITPEQVSEQEKRCPARYLVERIDEQLHKLDTFSIEEIKGLLKRKQTYLKDNKDSIIYLYRQHLIAEDSLFRSKTRPYTPEEEETEQWVDHYAYLVNRNHLMYRDTLHSGLSFQQIFRDSTLSLKMVGRNKGGTVYDFTTGQTIQPFYFLNQDSEQEISITNIYYHDTKEENVSYPVTDHSFPLNLIPMPYMKHVDSIDLHFNIKYLTKVDTLRFGKNEIGVEKQGIRLERMENNFVAYSAPYNYYENYPGKILEEEFYNHKGEVLQSEYGLENSPMESPEESYSDQLDYYDKILRLMKKSRTREEVYRALKYTELKRTNQYLRSKTLNRNLLKGNISSVKLYLENRRDSLSFDARFRNTTPAQEIHIDRFEEKTEFIDKNGKVLFQIPHSIRFLYDPTSDSYSQHYFVIDGPDRSMTYYFLDRKAKKHIKLPYHNLEFICPSLLWSMDADDKIQLLSPKENRVLTDKKFINFHKLYQTEQSIIMYSEEAGYYLYDQDKRLIGPKTSTPITRITLEKIEY